MAIDTQANNPALDQREESDFEKLKKANDEFERELLRAREMRAERNKIEAEKLLGSSAGANIPIKQMSEEDLKKEEAKNYWKGTAIEDALNKYNG